MNDEMLISHDGMPSWFPKMISYILDCLKNRDRFNLYNARKALHSFLPEKVIYASHIREALRPFESYGLSLRGKHQQIIMPHSRLVDFWKAFYLPAQSTKDCDLTFFGHMLRQKRHQDLTNDKLFRAYMPASYKSMKKESLVELLLRKIFSSQTTFEAYVIARLRELSPQAQLIFKSLSSEPKAYSDLLCKWGEDANYVIINLFELLLARPFYLERGNRLHLHLSIYNGYAEPYRITNFTPNKPVEVMQCLKLIFEHVSLALEQHEKPEKKDKPVLCFPLAQVRLMHESFSKAQSIVDFLSWWRKIPGFSPVEQKRLPDNYCLTQGPNGTCGVLAIEGYEPCEFIQKAMEFGLIKQDESGRLTMTRLGDWVGGGNELEMGVKDIWGRNIDRVILHLSPDWPSEFLDLLRKISVNKNNEYFITRENILERGVSFDQLIIILGSFVDLNAKRKIRLQSWFSDVPLPKILQASAVPFEEISDKRGLLKSGKRVLELDGHYIVIGLSPAKLKKSIKELSKE